MGCHPQGHPERPQIVGEGNGNGSTGAKPPRKPEILDNGKVNLVGDFQLYNTAAELTRIMGHKNPDRLFNDPSAIKRRPGNCCIHRRRRPRRHPIQNC
jgi:hypothetical protein